MSITVCQHIGDMPYIRAEFMDMRFVAAYPHISASNSDFITCNVFPYPPDLGAVDTLVVEAGTEEGLGNPPVRLPSRRRPHGADGAVGYAEGISQ